MSLCLARAGPPATGALQPARRFVKLAAICYHVIGKRAGRRRAGETPNSGPDGNSDVSKDPKRPSRRKAKEEPTFEQALARLEEIAQQLEGGELPLEQAIALAEEGYRLSESCETQLAKAEGRVQKLVERMGEAAVEPYEGEGNAKQEEDD